jgi:hypothetical protein
MKLGIYQSYIKEPQKFFAPSNPCRLTCITTQYKPVRRMSCSESPVVYIFNPTPVLTPPESQIEKLKQTKKHVNVQVNKVDLILQDFTSMKKPKSLKFKHELQGLKRPDTSKNFIGRKTFRPLTVNAMAMRRTSMY